MCGCTGFKSGGYNKGLRNLIIIDHSRMIQAFRIIEISKYDDGGQLTTRGQLMQGSSSRKRPPLGDNKETNKKLINNNNNNK